MDGRWGTQGLIKSSVAMRGWGACVVGETTV